MLALTEVRPEDKSELAKLVSTIKEGYSEKYEEAKRHWGRYHGPKGVGQNREEEEGV